MLSRMSASRTSNLLGALAVALSDALTEVTERGARHGAAAPAALVTIADEAQISIERLRQVLQLSHSGAVRLIDRLAADGLVERRSGRDQRSVSLVLTSAGRKAAAAVLAERQAVLDRTLAGLTAAERRSLTPLVEKLLAGVSAGRRSADHICRLCDTSVCPLSDCPVLE
jgi:DNA-binding MarR family transcriptional regulator